MIVGIDPGKSGAIVELTHDGRIFAHHLFPFDEGGMILYPALKELFNGIASHISGGKVFLERALPMAMGAKHAFNYGRDFQSIMIALSECNLPFELVEPSKWTKVICAGIDTNLKAKARSALALRQLMPSEVHKIPVSPKAKNMHDGVLEAALIAEYGRRQCLAVKS